MTSRVSAIGRRAVEVAADVAQIARNADVRPGQWKDRLVVVECCRRPTGRRMACRAIRKCKRRPGR